MEFRADPFSVTVTGAGVFGDPSFLVGEAVIRLAVVRGGASDVGWHCVLDEGLGQAGDFSEPEFRRGVTLRLAGALHTPRTKGYRRLLLRPMWLALTRQATMQ
ncbi:hypothetical protein L1887_51874 [Cichorium endivia]|nr:hypothetical protein L1887_51874 [Cichorium endivia]